MKYLILLSLILLSTMAYSQTISSENYSKLQLDLPNVEVVETSSSRIIIEASIKTSASPNLHKFLLDSNRYDAKITKDKTKDSIIISSNKKPPVIVKGEEIKEQVSYKVYVPKHIQLVNQI